MTRNICTVLLFAGIIGLFSGCSKQYPASLKIHSEPEGAHVVLRQGDQPWIYLGITPLNTTQIIDKKALKNNDKISLKTMRHGYMDQIKEWNDQQFREEIDNKGNIFWTPRLIKNVE